MLLKSSVEMGIPLIFADSTYSLRILLTIAVSATIQLY